jgi:hypothetical protein
MQIYIDDTDQIAVGAGAVPLTALRQVLAGGTLMPG